MQKIYCFITIVILSAAVYTQSNSRLKSEESSAAPAATDLNNQGVKKTLGGQQNEALKDFRRAIEISPDCLQCRYNLGRTLLKIGGEVEAVTVFRSLVKAKPDFADAFSGLGDALTGIGRPEEGAAAYKEALRLNPDDAVTLTNLGNSLELLNKHDEALAVLDRAVKLEPDLAGAHSNRGTTLFSLKRVKEAAECFRKSLSLDANSPETLNNLGVALDYLGKKDAPKYFEQALHIRPGWGFPVYNLALINLKRGQRDAARAGLASLERLDADLADSLRKQIWGKFVIEVGLRTSSRAKG